MQVQVHMKVQMQSTHAYTGKKSTWKFKYKVHIQSQISSENANTKYRHGSTNTMYIYKVFMLVPIEIHNKYRYKAHKQVETPSVHVSTNHYFSYKQSKDTHCQ